MKTREIIQKKTPTRSPRLVFIDHRATAGEAMKLMLSSHIHHLIVEKNGEVVGVVSDREIVAKCLDAGGHFDNMRPLSELCQSGVGRIQLDTDLNEVLRVMYEFATDCLIVMQNETVHGIVTSTDILRGLYEKSLEDQTDALDFANYTLSDPLIQRIMKTISDVGI